MLCFMAEDLKGTVRTWSKKIGKQKALARLIAKGVSTTTADKLCTGRYKSEPREKLSDILTEELRKDGFTLLQQGERAS